MKKAVTGFIDWLQALSYWLLRLVGVKLKEEQSGVLRQFIKFCMVGGMNATITLMVYYIFLFIDPDLYLLGNLFGYLAGIINAYFWNSHFVFHQRKERRGKSFIRMVLCYVSTYFLQAALLYLLVDVLCMSNIISPVIAILVITPINYLINKMWAFNKQ